MSTKLPAQSTKVRARSTKFCVMSINALIFRLTIRFIKMKGADKKSAPEYRYPLKLFQPFKLWAREYCFFFQNVSFNRHKWPDSQIFNLESKSVVFLLKSF